MKMFSKIKYRHKVAAVIFLFILLPFLILSTFIILKSWDEKVQSILEQNKSEMRIGVEAVNTLLLSSVQKLTFINNNSMISGYLNKESFNDFVINMTVYSDLQRTIDALSIDSPNINFILYPLNEKVFSGAYVEKLEKLEKRLSKDKTGTLQQLMALGWNENYWRFEKDEKSVDSIGKLGYLYCYKDMKLLNKTLAITEVKISISKVLRSIKGTFPKGSFIVYKPDSQSDNIVLQNSKQDIDGQNWQITSDLHKLNDRKYYPIELKLNYSQGTFNLFIPRTYIISELRFFLLIAIIIVVFAILILFLIVELASYLITRRLSRLIDRINENIENTNISSIQDRHSSEDDLGRMEDKFYGMLEKNSEFYKKALEYENEKKTLELELLQSRINPHFLYNTLSTMKWNSKNEKMADLIDSMVLYYRLALNKGDTIVKISQEMKLIEEYLKIQKYTYESDFLYKFQVEDEVKELLTVRNLLQPVVENAILHGINGMESGGMITLSGELKEGIVTLTVSDNGVGMSEETAQKLLYGEYESKMGGYGIKNVQKRINLFYGQDSTLNITSVPDKGTRVVITIPAVYPDKSLGINHFLA